MKPFWNMQIEHFGYVAPFAGAWIETPFLQLCLPDSRGAPFAGARIETGDALILANACPRRPLRGGVD